MFTNELIKKAHENAVAHGFWDPAPRTPETRALIHSEISESFEEWRNNRPNEYTGESGKPEGVWVELADVVLRVADLFGHLGVQLKTETSEFMEITNRVSADMYDLNASFAEFIDCLHIITTKTEFADNMDGTVRELIKLLLVIYARAEVDGIDLDGIVERKHAYNVTRPYRHGDKRL